MHKNISSGKVNWPVQEDGFYGKMGGKRDFQSLPSSLKKRGESSLQGKFFNSIELTLFLMEDDYLYKLLMHKNEKNFSQTGHLTSSLQRDFYALASSESAHCSL